MPTARQRRAKLKSKIACLSCKRRIARDVESTLAGIATLREEARRLNRIADERQERLAEYIAADDRHALEIIKCKRLDHLLKLYPDSDYRVLLHQVNQELRSMLSDNSD